MVWSQDKMFKHETVPENMGGEAVVLSSAWCLGQRGPTWKQLGPFAALLEVYGLALKVAIHFPKLYVCLIT